MWRLQTDTASVLTEAIGYIQFLHDQVQVITFALPNVWSLLNHVYDLVKEKVMGLERLGLCGV